MGRHSKPLVNQQPPKRGAAAQRQPRAEVIQQGNERIEVLSRGEPEEIDVNELRARDGGETEAAVDFDDLEEQAAVGPKVRRFEVKNGGQVQTQKNSQRTLVHAGKVCDELNFDIELMRRQGIKFEEVLEETG